MKPKSQPINDPETITTPEILVPQKSYLSFDPNNILPDEWFTAPYTNGSLQNILEKYQSVLARYQIGNQRFVEVLMRAAQISRINPKFGLVVLEREQSLVRWFTHADASKLGGQAKTYSMKYPDGRIETVTSNTREYRLDWACGFGCPDGQPKKAEYRGLGKQVEAMFSRYRDYFTEIETGKYKLEAPYQVDLDAKGKWTNVVYPKNKTTFALYRYCPHRGTPESPLYKQYNGPYGNYLSHILAVRVFFKEDFA